MLCPFVFLFAHFSIRCCNQRRSKFFLPGKRQEKLVWEPSMNSPGKFFVMRFAEEQERSMKLVQYRGRIYLLYVIPLRHPVGCFVGRLGHLFLLKKKHYTWNRGPTGRYLATVPTHQLGKYKIRYHHDDNVGYCSGNYEAPGASGKKYEAQIVIFCILLAINRFSWISWKVESRWGKSQSHWKKLESRWRKRKAVEESQKAIEESGKPLKKVESQLRKIGFCVRKIGF